MGCPMWASARGGCSPTWGFPIARTGQPRSCRTATGGCWRSRSPWPPRPGCCSWTSRPPGWARASATACWPKSAGSRTAAASPSCSSSMTWTWCSGWRPASSCSTRERCWRTALRSRSARTAGSARSTWGSRRPPPPRPAAEARPLLDVERLNAGYGLAHVLHDVTFRIARGEIVALLGRNGVGKTTTLRSLAGLTPPFPGSAVRLLGRDVAGRPPEEIARAGVSYVPDDRRIFPDLTARENLRVPVLALHRRARRWTEQEIAALFPPLAAAWDRKGRHLSGGEQKMLAIARALMTDPVLLLLDEPSEGLSPLIVRILVDALVRIREGGVTVLAADQNLHFARAIADRALVMDRGRLEIGRASCRER